MQKLVTVYLDSMSYSQGKWLGGGHHGDHHGGSQEHLREYLDDGWRVVQLHGFGGAPEDLNARGWIVAVLEKG